MRQFQLAYLLFLNFAGNACCPCKFLKALSNIAETILLQKKQRVNKKD